MEKTIVETMVILATTGTTSLAAPGVVNVHSGSCAGTIALVLTLVVATLTGATCASSKKNLTSESNTA